MRLLIYLLAMLTGFSAAEAARPVSAMPASVGAAVGQTLATVAVKAAKQIQVSPAANAQFVTAPVVQRLSVPLFLSVAATTPVLRHDVILG